MKPKIAVIVYHKNAELIYPKIWIDQFRATILGQSYRDFHIYEHNYGGGEYNIFYESQNKTFTNLLTYPCKTFVDSMNYLIDFCFDKMEYDYVFNTNVDDFYALNRIENQLIYLKSGYDVVASNFHLTRGESIIHSHRMNEQNIGVELSRNNNPIGHPVVAYSRNFWEKNKYYIPEEIPTEDLKLWQRSYKNGAKFAISPQFLLYHRIHEQSVCKNPNNR